ncbi:Rv1733c family protein [Streptomyces sp. NPDC001450]
MTAHGSPSASGPPRPHKGDAPHEVNPLRRTSDRCESWFRRVLMLVLLLGLPVAALSAGLTAYESSMRTVHAQAVERHEVTARLTSDVLGDGRVAKRPAPIRWTEKNGIVRAGTALVEPGTPKGTVVPVWVDRDGTITTPPMNAASAQANGWFVAGMAALGVALGVHAARAAVRLALDRRRYAQWEAEWDLVEPLWSGRFRR